MADTRTCPATPGPAAGGPPASEDHPVRTPGRSILYLGSDEFGSEYLTGLQNRYPWSRVVRSSTFSIPLDARDAAGLVLFEAGSPQLKSGADLQAFVRSMREYPLIALTCRGKEHRGIAAVRMGAQSFICIDRAGETEQAEIFAHARRRHHLFARLSQSDGAALSILHSINDGVILVDRHGRVLDINPVARSILGLEPRQLPSEGWAAEFCRAAADGVSLLEADDLPLVKASRGLKFSNQLATYRRADAANSQIILSINGQGLYDDDQNLAGGVITFRDVTDTVRRTVALQKRAQYDELTLLPNRSMFIRQLEKAIGRGKRSGKPIGVLFIDLDRFKSVNDTLGHDAGDELLRQTGERLTRNLRVGDFSGRWGGDEFVVCLEDLGEARNAAAAAQKLVLVLSGKYDVSGSEVYLTPSIGIAIHPDSGDNSEALIRAADLAMYQAKKRGGSRFHFYSEALNADLAQREELELGLRHALVRRELVLHYQPRVDVGSGRLIGFEVLLRWQHPRYGLLPPARFLPILESSGLIHSAGQWVIDNACRQLASWQRQYDLPDLSVAINLSPQQLMQGRLAEALERTLADTALDPGCIELEISDGSIVRARSSQYAALKSLRALGVRLSLDHFGTHDVSFHSLDAGMIDSFVLDASLIQDLADNGSHQRIVRAAIAMARGLDMEVAAEGVETAMQLEFLKSCQCDLAQGFLISRPMHADKVQAVLRSEIAGARLLSQTPAPTP